MAETQTLNFGPEWLRALSGGGVGSSVASPPLSPALPKYKLADYRYGREEMLALYVKDNMVPVDLHDKEFLPILQEEPLLPLALVPFTEEEQRNFSMSVNSTAVLRLTGRGGGTVAGAPRGRSSSRGRGRGRGDASFYQRSFDEVEGGFGRGGREMHRSQSWEERGDRRFEKPGRKDPDGAPAHFPVNHIRANYEDVAGNTRKHEFIRENWRKWILRPRVENHCSNGLRSAGWREHPDQRRRFPFDSRDEERSGYRRAQSGNGSVEEERDSLPEWCLEDAEEETGTFDSSGAFLSLKKAPKEPILEEAELDFRPLEESEEYVEREESESEQTKDSDMDTRQKGERSDDKLQDMLFEMQVFVCCSFEMVIFRGCSKSEEPSPVAVAPLERPTVPESCKAPPHIALPNSIVEAISTPHIATKLPDLPVPSSVLPAQPVSSQTQHVKPVKVPVAGAPLLPLSTGVVGSISRPTVLPSDMDEDEGLKHFEQEAEKMVAYLQDGGVDDERLAAKLVSKPTALHTTHEAAFKWFYKDPQGEIQGPFKNQEMSEWFQAGYFTMTLQVKRGCDEMFQPLGDIMKLWGRVPFTPGPTLPPMVGDAEQERMKRQQELNALNMFQMQQLQFQYLLRQQYAQALAQQKVLSSAPPPTQQQQQLNLLLHQALKIRTPEPQQSLLPPVTRSMSVPDSGSVWEMQNPSTQASCSPNMQPAAPSTWEGSSVWDLPLDSKAQVSSIEQQKAKAVKLEMERRDVELRAKREEEERKRLDEARRVREEEERKRLDEEELARRKQEEALQRQREQEEAERRRKEEEERLAQEEALRRLEEKRREEEERRKREELLRKQEGERRKQEELEALRRREEEKLQQQQEEEAAAAAALARQQQEEQKRREQETQRQRQQQQEALRRLQQQQQLAQMKLPSSSKWGQQSTTASTLSQSQNALSLAEIQKLEEERERQAQEEQRRLLQELQRNQPQQQLPQTKLSGWGNVAKQPPATKSLLEIQREEAQQMKQGKEQQQQQQQQTPQPPQQQQPSSVTQPIRTQNRATLSSSVWGSVNNIGSNWAMDSSSVWGDAQNLNVGFWDEAVKETPPPQATRKSQTQKNKGNANLSSSSSGKVSKKVEEEEKLMKLFQGSNNNQDGFMQWCEQTLHTLNTANNLDVPTFASFLKEVDSPYEVHDYVRAYLGDTPQAKDFAKQFLDRRAKQNTNQQKPQPDQQQKEQESLWGVSQVSQQVLHQQQQQQRFETVTSGKKKKKQKMVRADPSLLGFSVNAASERHNMGEIETVEDI
ncbi:GYF protein 2 PERQ amino acid-rich with [Triplophysa tibetana]|uniref:GYF protein 2 PERQ amino acid-rich with n=1 Tax=Triplophysa tibetana TaxID=1572043 RepID=A0A5A9P9K4_9TELE|nr:GYF protein 2 PERQ amino acid-rich with [Triplophysa tibetana]